MYNLLFRQNRFRRAISKIVLITFFMSSVVVNANAAIDMGRLPYEIPPTKPENFQFAHIDVETFTIPAHLGEINYSFKGESDRVVVHLQDAHCNSFAQYKISGIIDYMNNEYGINVINLEGGVGDYDLSVFTSISDGAIREEVADHFVKNGEINGAEFYAINNPDRVQLWGVEDRELYLKNLKIYRDSLKCELTSASRRPSGTQAHCIYNNFYIFFCVFHLSR